MGIRGENELEYLHVLPGKRGKAYLRRPAQIRRRQRRRYVIVGKDDRKIVRQKHGDAYYGLFGESNNPWRKGDEKLMEKLGVAKPPKPLRSRLDDIRERYRRKGG
eukprot:CAMPEP_0185275682 /NCGR_PEP_ID=MMETSP1359-20130426/54495_1 /TAXON_ID=552665 /ORGANISM="Bigelowiella longifila, Strain CCMP242" /LENGTH=104 /DNA_ID=CAMNT_0027869113 /DNA_START=122 /DNA_END=436 /DNA_ORIENTATION=-